MRRLSVDEMAGLSWWGKAKLAVAAMWVLNQNVVDPWGQLAFQWALDTWGIARVTHAARRNVEGLRLLRAKPYFTATQEELSAMPQGSFGHFLGEWYRRWGIQPFAPRRAAESDLEYFVTRLFQTHDVWHALAGYGTDLHNELRLLFFMLGQYFSGSAVLAILFGAARLLRESGWRAFLGLPVEFARIARRSRRAQPLSFVIWEELLHLPVEQVRATLLQSKSVELERLDAQTAPASIEC